jgi:hypothetical protein
LKRHAQLARKRGREQLEKAEMEVRTNPIRYTFALKVTLYQKEERTGQHEEQGDPEWTALSPLIF